MVKETYVQVPASDETARDGCEWGNLAPTAVETLAGSYRPKVRACYDLISLLKRTRPHLHEQVVELEGLVARAHQRLENAQSSCEAADSLCGIESAYQMLLELKRVKA